MYVDSRVRRGVFADFPKTVAIGPGKDGIGAVVLDWIEASRIHRAAVGTYEELAAAVEQRTAENDIARKHTMRKRKEWYRENDMPDQFEEYRELKAIKALGKKGFSLRQQRRWKAVHDRGEELDVIFDALKELEAHYLATRTALEDAEGGARDAELRMRYLRTQITADHRRAEQLKQPIRDSFPTVHLNDQLVSINGKNLQRLPFEQIVEDLSSAFTPHRVAVRMYALVRDAEADEWITREEMLASKRFVPDLRVGYFQFLQAAREGHLPIVRANLHAAIDVDCSVSDGITALHLAASTGNAELIALLVEYDADPDARDENRLTPLHHACLRGGEPAVRQLLLAGADPSAVDRDGRSLLMIAAAGGHDGIARLLLARDPKQAEQVDSRWEWNALHYAARQGALGVARALIAADEFALHMRSTRGATPIAVARQARQAAFVDMVIEHMRQAPAQKVYAGADGELWLGGEAAAEEEWARHTMRFQAVVVIQESYKVRFATAGWLSGVDEIADYACTVPNSRMDSTAKSWGSLTKELKSVLAFIRRHLQPGARVLVMDRLGQNTAAAVVLAFLITRKGQHLFPALAHLRDLRPCVELSQSYLTGLDQLEEGWVAAQLRRKERMLATAVMTSMKFSRWSG